MPTLRAERLSKELGGRVVLRDVTFRLESGDCLALFGANGAGKSTLLNLLTTLTKPTSGRIVWNDVDVYSTLRAYRRSIGYVGHEPCLYLDWSGRANLDFFGRLYGVAGWNARRDDLLDDVGLTAFADEPVRIYSRGMLQRLAIARAFLHAPTTLFLDEAFTGLDAASQERLLLRLEAARRDGATTLLVTHDLELGYRAGTSFAVLRRGALETLSQPTLDELRAAYAGESGG
jgi:heme exporter protein A